MNLLGADLYASLAKDNTDNLVFSSASIMLALAMTRAGALGTTGTEMDRVLRASLTGPDSTALHHALNALSAALDSRTGEFTVDEQTLPVELAVANSLWGQDGLPWASAFLDLLATEYGAGMRVVDYLTQSELARETINRWVAQQTRDRIPELLAKGTITPDVVLALVNAIYLKAPWLERFPTEATRDAAFHNIDGSTVEVPMMNLASEMQYAAAQGWQAVELAYVGGSLAMTIIVPDAEAFASVEGQLGSGLVDEVTRGFTSRPVSLSLPKFDVETKVELSQVMSALGMSTAFDPDRADFSAMVDAAAPNAEQQRLYIGQVIHQANIDVDEKGTTAAAAMAVVMRATAAPGEPVLMTFDRPFLFALRDVPTGAVLFLGRVGDPTAGR